MAQELLHQHYPVRAVDHKLGINIVCIIYVVLGSIINNAIMLVSSALLMLQKYYYCDPL